MVMTCGKHRQQLAKHGEIQYRTLASGNDYLLRDTHYEIVIYGRDLKERGRALIDKEDRKKVEAIGSWCMCNGYAMNGKIGTTMHIFLMGKKKGLEIDHLNGNKLDNRRINLRFVKHAVNTQSWVRVYKLEILRAFQAHLAEGKDAESFFKEVIS